MDLDFVKSFNIMLYDEEEQEEDTPIPETLRHEQVRDVEQLHIRQDGTYRKKPKLNQIFHLPRGTKSTKKPPMKKQKSK